MTVLPHPSGAPSRRAHGGAFGSLVVRAAQAVRRIARLALLGIAAAVALTAACPTPGGRADGAFRRGAPTMRLLGRAHTGSLPKSVTASPDGRSLVVSAFGQRDTGNLEFFEAATLRRSFALDIRGNPVETLFTRSGAKLYVSSFSAARVMEVDVAARRVLRELPAGVDPKTLALSPDERTLYVVNWRSRDVSVVDLARGVETARAHVGPHPRGVFTRADGRLVVASTDADELVEFDAAGTRRRVVRTCRFPRELVPTRAGVYVTCSGLSRVWRLDAEALTRGDGADVGRNPRSAAASSDGRYLAVANFDGRSVTVLDLVARTRETLTAPDVGRIVGVDVLPGSPLRVAATSWETRELLLFGPLAAPALTPGRRGVRPLSPAAGSR